MEFYHALALQATIHVVYGIAVVQKVSCVPKYLTQTNKQNHNSTCKSQIVCKEMDSAPYIKLYKLNIFA